jgi:hypothetical protein
MVPNYSPPTAMGRHEGALWLRLHRRVPSGPAQHGRRRPVTP